VKRAFSADSRHSWNTFLQSPSVPNSDCHSAFGWALRSHLITSHHGALWPSIYSAIEKRFTYLFTYLLTSVPRRFYRITFYCYIFYHSTSLFCTDYCDAGVLGFGDCSFSQRVERQWRSSNFRYGSVHSSLIGESYFSNQPSSKAVSILPFVVRINLFGYALQCVCACK